MDTKKWEKYNIHVTCDQNLLPFPKKVRKNRCDSIEKMRHSWPKYQEKKQPKNVSKS